MHMLKKDYLYAGIFVLTCYIGYKVYQRRSHVPEYTRMQPVKVTTHIMDKRQLARKYTYPATLQAIDSAVITAEQPGRIKTLNLVEGQLVKKGDLLVEIENEVQQGNLDAAKAVVEEAQSNLIRVKNLVLNKDIPSVELKSAKLRLDKALGELKTAQSHVDKMVIMAPFDGMIGIRKVSQGAHVQPNTEIARLNQQDRLRVLFSVPVSNREYVLKGNHVEVVIGKDPVPVIAQIVAQDSNLQQNSSLLDVVGELYNDDDMHMPGQHAKVLVTSTKPAVVLALPESSLLYDDYDNPYVFVVRNGVSMQKGVELGSRRSSGFVEVQSGLQAGDVVVTNVGENRGSNLMDNVPVIEIANDTDSDTSTAAE